MKKTGLLTIFFSIFFFASCLFAQDNKDTVVREFKTDQEEARAYNVVYTTKTVDGLTFNVQEDRPIEKVGGVYRPLDMDSYVALKFSKMQEKLNNVEASLSDKIDALSKKIDDLAERVDSLEVALRNRQADQSQSKTQ
ncbi:MAG TPA: hypothetical protein PLU24_04230 [Candidatus Omnitrophota bacterium]|nr:hypothetical protein [Candidatus Omnitrophota bacterium]